MSIANGKPQIELPTDYPSDMMFRLQDPEFLIKTHDLANALIPHHGIQQVGLRAVTFATLESESLVTALDLGASVYSAVESVTIDPRDYDPEVSFDATFRGINSFTQHVDLDENKLLELLRLARARLNEDAPLLSEVVEEVLSAYLKEKGLLDVAMLGAGAMRGLNNRVNRFVIASRFDDSEANDLLAS